MKKLRKTRGARIDTIEAYCASFSPCTFLCPPHNCGGCAFESTAAVSALPTAAQVQAGGPIKAR